MAGLQPHLARVRLIRLWAGWGCTPVVHESNHGTQDKPAITTHTQERDVGGAQQSHFVVCGRVNSLKEYK